MEIGLVKIWRYYTADLFSCNYFQDKKNGCCWVQCLLCGAGGGCWYYYFVLTVQYTLVTGAAVLTR